ncbi:MAG: response regulator [Caulobacterales bacterium]|nr:response regulator [Caulobacterales bacterium]
MLPRMDATGGTAPARQLTAIVVDDDADLLGALRFSLELDGLRVITHRTADTVRAAALPLTDACLVLDYKLPSANGLELLDSLRAAGITLPAILVTSHANVEVRRRTREADAVLIEKPLLGETLVTAIRAAIARRQS